MNTSDDATFFSFTAFIRYQVCDGLYLDSFVYLSKITDADFFVPVDGSSMDVFSVFVVIPVEGKYVRYHSILRDTPKARDYVYCMILKHQVRALIEFGQPTKYFEENKHGNV